MLNHLDLADCVVTADALHRQESTVAHIVTVGGAYLMTVKSNHPGLLAWAWSTIWMGLPPSRVTKFGHGQRGTRTTRVLLLANEDLSFPHARQLIQVRRTRTVYPEAGSDRKPEKSVEVVYLLCSLGYLDAPTQTLAGWVQSHWRIENALHWVRDVTLSEDSSRVCAGNVPRVMATLRSTVIGLLRLDGHASIAAALRFHGRDPGRTSLLVGAAHQRF